MNYKGYPIRKKLSKFFNSVMVILTYPLRRSYDNNGVVYKLSIGSNARQRRKKFIKEIFYHLDQNGDCYILTNGVGYDGNWFDIDLWSGVDNTVLEDTKWLKKNKLKVTQVDPMEFMEKYKVPSYCQKQFKEYEIIKIRE